MENTKKSILIYFFIAIAILTTIYIVATTLKNKEIDINKVEFYLNGNEIVELEEGSLWTDPLFVATHEGKSMTSYVSIGGNVDTSKPGTYQITYTLKLKEEKILTRTIIVKEKTNQLKIVLNGNDTIYMYAGDIFTDPGYTAYNGNKNITNEVLVNGEVNTLIEGEYEINYTVSDNKFTVTKTRKVIVKEKINNLKLTLNGEKTIYLQLGSPFKEPGYIAYDDGVNVTSKVVVTGKVNPNAQGEYILKYTISNDNFSAEEVRKIIVVTLNYNIYLKNKEQYVKDNTVIFTTTDNNYSHILLPNGKKEYNKNVSYQINNNGKYTFKIYNKFGFYEQKDFTINNIDKTSPTGTCTGYLYDTYTKLIVNAKDDVLISNYEYLYGSKSSSKTTSNEYKYYDYINEAKVNIYDGVNNKTSITCSMIDKSTSTESSYKSYKYKDSETSRTMNYWLYTPKNLTKRNSVPLLVYMHGDGSRGTDLSLVNRYAYPKFVKEGEEYPFMLLAPQITYETNWTDEKTYKTLMNLINKITKEYNVNTKKIIISGGSSGGGGVYIMVAAYPKFFSCAVVGSGLYSSSYRKVADKLIYTPMWVFHGTKDASISYSSVKSLAEYISSLGGNVKFVSIEGGTHSVTETTDGFKNPELIKWMISQERK